MNKKAIILYTILRLVVGAAVLLILFAIIFNISAIFLTPELSQGSASSFEKLINTANRLVAKDSTLKSTIVQFDIDDPYVLFGFTYPAQPVVIEECTFTGSNVVTMPSGKPPVGCDNKPCFCICHEDDNCKKPVECRNINESVKSIWIEKGISEHSLGGEVGNKQSVALFGDCGHKIGQGEWEVTALNLKFDASKGELLISS